MGLALAVHPSLEGALLTARFCGAVALAWTIWRASADGHFSCARSVLVATALEIVVVCLQRAHGGPVGLGVLGERQQAFYLQGRVPVPRGTFSHPYVLTGFLLAAVGITYGERVRWTPVWFAAVGAVIGCTFSRSAVLALLVFTVVAATRWRDGDRMTAAAVGALLAAVIAVAIVSLSGWQARSHQTWTSTTADEVSSYRVTAARDAVHLIAAHPLFGFGPGNAMGPAAASRYADRSVDLAHDVPLLLAAEAGIPVGLLAVAAVAAASHLVRRAGWSATFVFVSYLPFILFDNFPYATPQGLAITAVWCGALGSLLSTGVS
jgi:hypothetical protein